MLGFELICQQTGAEMLGFELICQQTGAEMLGFELICQQPGAEMLGFELICQQTGAEMLGFDCRNVWRVSSVDSTPNMNVIAGRRQRMKFFTEYNQHFMTYVIFVQPLSLLSPRLLLQIQFRYSLSATPVKD